MAVYVSIIMFTTIFVVFSEHPIATPSGWSEDTRLTNDGSQSNDPVVAVNGNNTHLVWTDERDGNQEIYYKRSTNNGENWGSDTRLTNDGSVSNTPVVAVNGNNIHVVWKDERDGNYEIYYKRSTNNGENWGSDTRLTNDGSYSFESVVAVNGNNIHVVWRDNRDGNYEIYYKRSTNNGENWGSDTRLTNDGSNYYNPVVAVNGNNIHLVWTDERDGNEEIYYKRSTNNGENWGSDTRLTNDGSQSYTPVVAVNENNIHLVWRDNRDGNHEIYYKRSTNNGGNWGSDTRLTNDGSYSYDPVVAVNGNNIHVVWQEYRNGNYEIYYKQKLNQKPTADTLDFSANHVYKEEAITLYTNASDDNDQESDLTPTFEYKPTVDTTWQNTCISDVAWDSIGWYWKATFTPSEGMETGLYDFRVKFTDSDSMDSDWRDGAEQMDVREHPIAVLSASSTNIMKGESVTFNASTSTGKELVYYFDFGDGTTSDWGYDAVKTHKYSEEGTYIAKVKVKDTYDEESLWDSIEITVDNSKSDEGDSTPGFELIFPICAIALILFWKRKR